MLRQHRVKILKAIARILFSYANSVEQAVSKESSPEEQPLEYCSNDTPPAHWLAKVRQGAPHLLEQGSFEYPATQPTTFNQEYATDTNEAITVKNEKEISIEPENLSKKKQQFSLIKTIYRLVHVKQSKADSHNKENRTHKTRLLHPEENKSSGRISSKKKRSGYMALKSARIDPDKHIDKQSTAYKLQQPDKINKQKNVSVDNKHSITETIKQPPIQLKPAPKLTPAYDRSELAKKRSPVPVTSKETKQRIIKLSPKPLLFQKPKKHMVSVKKVEASHTVTNNTKKIPRAEITEKREPSFSRATSDDTINLNLKTRKITPSVQTNLKKTTTFASQQEESDGHKIGITNHWPQLPEDEWLKSDNNSDRSIQYWQLQTEIKNKAMSEHEQRGRLWNV